MRVFLKDACGTSCTALRNHFEMNTLHTTICSVLEQSEPMCGVALMPIVPIRMNHKNVLYVEISLQVVPPLQ